MQATRPGSRAAGFSLLEMVVAIAILALALGMLYQAAGGATRNVRSDEKYAFGVELARSLLAEHSSVPRSGVQASGETAGGFRWSVFSESADPAGGVATNVLQRVEIRVSWDDGLRRPEVRLDTIVEGFNQ